MWAPAFAWRVDGSADDGEANHVLVSCLALLYRFIEPFCSRAF